MGFLFWGSKKNKEKKERKKDGQAYIRAGIVDEAINQSAQKTAVQFEKSTSYNRASLEDLKPMYDAKKVSFAKGNVVDPYTDNELVMKKFDAKAQYGENWQDHLAEADHIKPLNEIYSETKDNPWLTNDNVKNISNDVKNLQVTSRTFNNAKRDRNNKKFVTDDGYIKDKNVPLTPSGKERAIADGRNADEFVKYEVFKNSGKNIINTAHNTGVQTAIGAGGTVLTISGIQNIVDVVKGEKTPEDALADTMKDGGKVVATSYGMGAIGVVTKQTFAKTFAKLPEGLAGAPIQIVTAVTMTGKTLMRFADGEITYAECLYELGEKGVNTLAVGYAMGVGQAVIPIPIVGAAIGAMVGSVLTSTYAQKLRETLQGSQAEHQERLRIMAECEKAIAAEIQYRAEVESVVAAYFVEHRKVFTDALSEIHSGFQLGDAVNIISGANRITRKLGGHVQYETISEFEDFLADDHQMFVL